MPTETNPTCHACPATYADDRGHGIWVQSEAGHLYWRCPMCVEVVGHDDEIGAATARWHAKHNR